VLVQAIPVGSEVLISYLGEKPSKSSTQLMKDYGFILPGNTNDTLTFKVQGAEQAVCSQGAPSCCDNVDKVTSTAHTCTDSIHSSYWWGTRGTMPRRLHNPQS
jgi:hypothetical protein